MLPLDFVKSPSLEVLGMVLINMSEVYLALAHSGRWITYLFYHPYDLVLLVIIQHMELFS